MKSKKVKKILLIALTCVAISASVSAEAAMKSQITIESKNKYEQLKISESRVYGEYPTGDYKKIMLLPSVSKVEKFCFEDNLNIEEVEWMAVFSISSVVRFSADLPTFFVADLPGKVEVDCSEVSLKASASALQSTR